MPWLWNGGPEQPIAPLLCLGCEMGGQSNLLLLFCLPSNRNYGASGLELSFWKTQSRWSESYCWLSLVWDLLKVMYWSIRVRILWSGSGGEYGLCPGPRWASLVIIMPRRCERIGNCKAGYCWSCEGFLQNADWANKYWRSWDAIAKCSSIWSVEISLAISIDI
jgi:hypothetical protein